MPEKKPVSSSIESTENWDLIIQPRNKWYELHLKEIFQFKDLLFLFVKRDFVATYKQTILGPLWFLLQPILTTLTFTVIFGNLAKISTNGVPPILFYLSGLTLWTYFADCLNRTSETFISNAAVFGKVYFPRMVVPLSIVLSSMIKLAVQFLLFMAFWAYFFFNNTTLHPNGTLFIVPFLVLLMGLLGLGFGIIISSMTTKYRDFKFLVAFGVQLLMYASPIVYPLSIVPSSYKWLLLLNPLTAIIEAFKYAFFGQGEFSWPYLGYSTACCFIVIIFGLVIFNKVEKSFIDTV